MTKIRKIIRKIDNILAYFTDFSIDVDWYLPHFGEKRRAFYDKKYGYYIEGWFYPDDEIEYFCTRPCPRDILFLEK